MAIPQKDCLRIMVDDEINPLNQSNIANLQSQTKILLPPSYQTFLSTYGYGSINKFLIFSELDTDYMQNNFADMLDFWDWENDINSQISLNSAMICTTIDGDIVLIIEHTTTPFLLLPRGIPTPKFFTTLDEIIAYYAEEYNFQSLTFVASQTF